MNREMVTYDGRTQSRAEWAKELGLSKSGLTNRINSLGVERAISEPVSTGRRLPRWKSGVRR